MINYPKTTIEDVEKCVFNYYNTINQRYSEGYRKEMNLMSIRNRAILISVFIGTIFLCSLCSLTVFKIDGVTSFYRWICGITFSILILSIIIAIISHLHLHKKSYSYFRKKDYIKNLEKTSIGYYNYYLSEAFEMTNTFVDYFNNHIDNFCVSFKFYNTLINLKEMKELTDKYSNIEYEYDGKTSKYVIINQYVKGNKYKQYELVYTDIGEFMLASHLDFSYIDEYFNNFKTKLNDILNGLETDTE